MKGKVSFCLIYCSVFLFTVCSQQKHPWNTWTLDIFLEKSASWSLMVWKMLLTAQLKSGRQYKTHHQSHPFPSFIYRCKITLSVDCFFLRVRCCDCCLFRPSLAARNASAPPERLDAVRKLAASQQCPLLFAEDQVCSISSREHTWASIAPQLCWETSQTP